MRHSSQTSPYRDVDNKDVWQDAPQAVDLRVVAVDLGRDQSEKPKDQGKEEARNQRVRRHADRLYALEAANVVPEAKGQLVELRHEGLNDLAVVDAIVQRFHVRQHHGGSFPDVERAQQPVERRHRFYIAGHGGGVIDLYYSFCLGMDDLRLPLSIVV